MKKVSIFDSIVSLIVILMFVSLSYASGGEQDISSPSTQTADAAIMDNAGFFKGFVITPDGTNAVTITFYDNASAASGTKLLPTMTFAGDGGTQGFSIPAYIQCKNGIYADITTVGTVEYTVFYRDK